MVEKSASRYNELTGKEWLQYSFSIWRDIRKQNEEKQLKHPAMFPLQLSDRVIDIFTKKKDVVLDPFMGTGSTIVAAYQKQRLGIGFELSKEYVAITNKRLKELKKNDGMVAPHIFNKDSRLLLEDIGKGSVSLCMTSPPYWDILNMRRTADGKKTVNYGGDKTDLGNIADYNSFLNELKTIFSGVFQCLKANGHCVVVLMDLRKKDQFYSFHSDFADRMKEIGFSFEDIVIWDRQHEYNNMKPLGYPYVFRVNKVHEYILVFKKRIK